MKNERRTRADVSTAVACGDPLTAEQREYLNQNGEVSAMAQDFEILHLRFDELQVHSPAATDALRSRVAEISNSSQPRRISTRRLGYAFATVLAVTIVAGPFVTVIQSRATQKQSGKSIWDTSLKGKAIEARISGIREKFYVRVILTKASFTVPSTNNSKVESISARENTSGVESPGHIYIASSTFRDSMVPPETGSNFIPFVTLEGCRKGYGRGAREWSETRKEATFTYSEYSFERAERNQLVRVVVHPGQEIVTSLRFLRRKNATSPYIEEEAVFLTVRSEAALD